MGIALQIRSAQLISFRPVGSDAGGENDGIAPYKVIYIGICCIVSALPRNRNRVVPVKSGVGVQRGVHRADHSGTLPFLAGLIEEVVVKRQILRDRD